MSESGKVKLGGTPPTIGAAVASVAAQLVAAGIAEARREARLLIAAALGCDAATVIGYPERGMTIEASARVAAFAARRASREPVARIIGHREFWGLDFVVSPATLVPRPDSETVIEAALEFLADRSAPLRVIDFGTGTGCLLLALLKELPAATGLGVDLAHEAAATARCNAERLGLAQRAKFLVSFWGRAVAGSFDVILANPPYIPSGAIAGLAPEVARFDPALALDGGMDGLASFRQLAPDIARLLHEDGKAFVELGADQAGAVAAVMEQTGLAICTVRRDLSGIERCLVVRRRP